MKIQLLHGFLGVPGDWTAWQELLSAQGHECLSVNLWSDLQDHTASLADFAKEYVDKFLEEPAVLIGYSMGGRLALEVAKLAPSKVTALVLFSTQFVSPVSFEERVVWQENWVNRFLNEDWSLLLESWNAQAVFSGSSDLPRVESDFDRALLSETFMSWSILKQDLSPECFPAVKTLWLSGELDGRIKGSLKFISSKLPNVETFVQSGAGHRFVFENHFETQEKVVQFLADLS